MSRAHNRPKLSREDRAKRVARNERRARDSAERREKNDIALREQRAYSGALRMFRSDSRPHISQVKIAKMLRRGEITPDTVREATEDHATNRG